MIPLRIVSLYIVFFFIVYNLSKMDYTGFKWRQVEPEVPDQKIWQRDIDECEYFYYAVSQQYKSSGRSFFHMTGHLSLRVATVELGPSVDGDSLFDNALQKAWLSLRKKHPGIASQIKWDHTRQKYMKEYRSEIRGWEEETLVFVRDGKTGCEFANSDPPAPASPTLYVLCPRAAEGEGNWTRRDLVFRSPHDIIDGIGTLYLLNNFAELVSETLASGNIPVTADVEQPEESRLSPPFRIAADVPADITSLVQNRLDEAESVYDSPSTSEAAEPIGVPYKKGALLPGKHQRVELVLGKDETAQVLASCKQLGVTVTHVFHAAIAIVLRDLQERPNNGTPLPVQYVNYILRNERASCKPPFNNGKLHPAGVYHSVSSQKLVIDMLITPEATIQDLAGERKTAFLDATLKMRDFYNMVRDDKQHSALVPFIWAQGTPEIPLLTNDASELPVPPPKDIAPVSISSMGRIDSIMPPNHGIVELYNPWVTGEELKNGLGLFLGTFRGQLEISAAYNDAWHDEQGAMRFLQECLAIVRNGLDLH